MVCAVAMCLVSPACSQRCRLPATHTNELIAKLRPRDGPKLAHLNILPCAILINVQNPFSNLLMLQAVTSFVRAGEVA